MVSPAGEIMNHLFQLDFSSKASEGARPQLQYRRDLEPELEAESVSGLSGIENKDVLNKVSAGRKKKVKVRQKPTVSGT